MSTFLLIYLILLSPLEVGASLIEVKKGFTMKVWTCRWIAIANGHFWVLGAISKPNVMVWEPCKPHGPPLYLGGSFFSTES